jgi:hypothetical protein
MRFNRQLIREFIIAVEWATASNIYHLFGGKIPLRDISSDLKKMTNCKDRGLRLKVLDEEVQVYSMANNEKRRTVHHQHFKHDARLRDCLAKFCWNFEDLTIDTFADAKEGKFYLEFDNGTMTSEQIEEKIKKHYKKAGAYQVIFWMYPREYIYHRDVERIKALEQKRLEMLFEIVKKLLKDKPNRILGACYHTYLSDGKLYNYRGKVSGT